MAEMLHINTNHIRTSYSGRFVSRGGGNPRDPRHGYL